MTQLELNAFKYQLEDRKQKLQESIQKPIHDKELKNLLNEVDRALDKMKNGTFGLCEVCKDPIEDYRLKKDPLACFCLDHLSAAEQRALEQDIQLAVQIQNTLLPKNDAAINGWEYSYHYEPADLVSGDFCDIVPLTNDLKKQLFIVGDVSGKGIAASMLMSHLHAIFRSLTSINSNVTELVETANRLFCDSTMATHYATLSALLVSENGEVEICNAGHCLPLVIRKQGVEKVEATGVPIGLFCSSKFDVSHYKLESGDSILLYTDGLSEASNKVSEYGTDRILKLAGSFSDLNPKNIISNYLTDLKSFLGGNTRTDDLTMLAIKKL